MSADVAELPQPVGDLCNLAGDLAPLGQVLQPLEQGVALSAAILAHQVKDSTQEDNESVGISPAHSQSPAVLQPDLQRHIAVPVHPDRGVESHVR